MPDYQRKVAELTANADNYHASYYAAQTFRGPSLYFHRKALEKGPNTDFTRRLEYIYATLTAWGMHRMGSGGSKMLPFDTFHQSVKPLTVIIEDLQNLVPSDMTEESWDKLAKVFKGIQIMASGTTIVGNSKVMAHLLPNLVPPIDRQYTLRYLRGNTWLKNDVEKEWLFMREIISNFFIPVSMNEQFRQMANRWISDQITFPWDTSGFKVVDNLIIGALKLKPPKTALVSSR